MLKMLKVYRVKPEDIDSKGNVKPDAKLWPHFSSFYAQYGMDIRPERMDDELVYEKHDNGIRQGRKYDVRAMIPGEVIPDTDVYVQENDVPVRNRGFSGVGFASKNNAKGTLLQDPFWDNDKRIVTYFPTYAQALKSNKNLNSDNIKDIQRYEDNLLQKVPGINVKDDVVGGNTDATMNYLKKGFGMKEIPGLSKETINALQERDKSGVQSSINSILNDSQNIYGVPYPFLIMLDDDDLIKMNDILDKGFDPQRDDIYEKQIKAIRGRKPLPDFLTKRAYTHDTSFPDSIAAVDLCKIILESINRLDQQFDKDGNFIGNDGIKYYVMPLLSHINALLKDYSFVLNDTDEDRLIHLCDDITTHMNDESYVQLCIVEVQLIINSVYKKCTSKSHDEIVKNKQFNILDYFDYDDPMTLSDAQYKFIIKDIYNDYCANRQNNIVNGIKEFGQ